MRVEQLTFTRFIAALSIVIYHFGVDISPFNNIFLTLPLKQGYVGVSFFFILSGFVMILAYSKNKTISTYDYLKKRFARIYPIYFISILLLLTYFIFQKISIDINGLILNLFVIQSWFSGKAFSFNGPGWSLSVEFFFYLLFPFLWNNYFSRFNYNKLIIPLTLFFILSQILFSFLVYKFGYTFPTDTNDYIVCSPLMHLNEFLLGNLFGLIYIKRFKTISMNFDLLILFVILLILLLLNYPIGIYFHNGLLSIIFIPLILLISMNNGIITRIFKLKPFIFLGEISYGIYILQLPIFWWTYRILSHYSFYDKTYSFYIYVFVLLLCSSLSYIFIETPLRLIITKLKNK